MKVLGEEGVMAVIDFCGAYFEGRVNDQYRVVGKEGMTLTLKTRTGLSPVRGSNMFKVPDNESDTRSFWPLQVLPSC